MADEISLVVPNSEAGSVILADPNLWQTTTFFTGNAEMLRVTPEGS